MACADCGGDGACFCTGNDELDCGVGDWLHPTCYAKRNIHHSENLKCFRRTGSHELSPQKRAPMSKVRHRASRLHQPKPQLLCRL